MDDKWIKKKRKNLLHDAHNGGIDDVGAGLVVLLLGGLALLFSLDLGDGIDDGHLDLQGLADEGGVEAEPVSGLDDLGSRLLEQDAALGRQGQRGCPRLEFHGRHRPCHRGPERSQTGSARHPARPARPVEKER